MKALRLSTLFVFLASSAHVSAGLLLFSDINTTNNGFGNPILQNLLGSGTDVVLSKQNSTSFANTNLAAFFGSLLGVSVTDTTAEITTLAPSPDMLVLNIGFTSLVPYDAPEVAYINTAMAGGTDVVVIAEPFSGSTAAVNQFLTDIGSGMSLGPTFGSTSSIATILDFPLTAGAAYSQASTFNPITGGTALVNFDGLAAVAAEGFSVPAPATLALLGFGLLGLRLRRKA